MSETEHSRDDLRCKADVFLPRLIRQTGAGCARSRRKLKRLADSQSREMHIVFRRVLHVAAVVFLDILRRKRVVMDFSFYAVIFAALVGKSAKESGATSPRATKDN